MKFIIRDDDLNYFSTPADIERWYANIFAQGIPVGFSTIPFVKPTSDVYTGGVLAEDREYPMSENTSVCAFVKGQDLIEILQHGTTHETVGDVFEYARQVPRGETMRGRKELERAFGRSVSVFVPPHDWISSSGIRDVEHAGMDIIRGRGAGLRAVLPRPLYLWRFISMCIFKLLYTLKGKAVPAYPYVLNFGRHQEVCSYRLEDTDVFEGLEYVHKKDGIYVVVTHLHFYTDEKKERLLKVIERAKELGADFVRPSTLFHRS